MDLKEFTKQTIQQIVEGVVEANQAIESKNAYINCYDCDFDDTFNKIIKVDYDVAITATEVEGSQVGAGIKVASLFSAGGSADSKTENQSVSRIKFSLELALPYKEE